MKTIENIWKVLIRNSAEFLIFYVLLGVVLIFLSIPLGNAFVNFSGTFITHAGQQNVIGFGQDLEKQVGYVSALNWSLVSILIPFSCYGFIRSKSELDNILIKLSDKNMLFKNSKPMTKGEIIKLAASKERSATRIFICVFALVMIYVIYDLFEVVIHPLIDPNILIDVKITDPVYEFDWSISALYPDVFIDKYKLISFDVVVYVIIAGFGGAFTISSLMYILIFESVLHVNLLNSQNIELRIDFDSDDPRAGFEILEDFYNYIVIAVGIAIFCLYIMSVQNIYLRDTESTNILKFIGSIFSIVTELQFTLGNMGEIFFKLFDISDSTSNKQSITGIFIVTIIDLFVFISIVRTLRGAASSARDNSLIYISKLINNTSNDSVKSELESKKDNITKMKLWPLGWVSHNMLLTMAFILSLSVFFIKILPFLIAFFLITKILSFVSSFLAR